MLLVSRRPKFLHLKQCAYHTVFCLVPDHYTVIDYSVISSESLIPARKWPKRNPER